MATLDLQVGAGADDANETDADTSFSSTSIYVRAVANIATASSRWNGGLRFQSVTIAQGSTIDVAYLTLVFPSGTEDNMNADLLMEDVDDAVSFATNADVTSRTRTASSVQWTVNNLGQNPVNSPSIVVPVQAVISRGGFASGNDVVAFMDGRAASPEVTAWAQSYDGNAANAAKLHVEYSAGGGAARRIFVIST